MACCDTTSIIEKWYKKLCFPTKYDGEFCAALAQYRIPASTSIDTYDIICTDGKKNLLSALYMCEALEGFYLSRGISHDVLLATLHDIVLCTQIGTNLKGTLYLGELSWLRNHLQGSIFNVGRLQFNMAPAEHAIPEKDIRQGDPIVEIHIPGGTPLTPELVDDSFRAGAAFLATYFPEYSYRYYTCHSWLFDPIFKEYLKPDSNILAFQDRFEMTVKEPSDRLLLDVFGWDATRENLANFTPKSSFAAKIKERVLAGHIFYEVTGVIAK